MSGTLDSSEIRWIIDNLVKDLLFYRDQRANCHKWCISIWIASIIALATGKLQIQFTGALLVLLAPIGLFWLLEGMYGGITIIINGHIREAEKSFASGHFDRTTVARFMLISGRDRYGFRQKLLAFINALFKVETVFLFYGVISIVSCGFCLLFQSIGLFVVAEQIA